MKMETIIEKIRTEKFIIKSISFYFYELLFKNTHTTNINKIPSFNVNYVLEVCWQINLGRIKTNRCGDSQNFLRKFVRFFVTLGLKILRLFSRL